MTSAIGRAFAVAVLVLVSAGCAGQSGTLPSPGAPSSATRSASATIAAPTTPSATPTMIVPVEPSPTFRPDEDAYITAIQKVDPLLGKGKWRQTQINGGWVLCQALEGGVEESVVSPLAHPNPAKAKAVIAAARTYLCPDVTG